MQQTAEARSRALPGRQVGGKGRHALALAIPPKKAFVTEIAMMNSKLNGRVLILALISAFALPLASINEAAAQGFPNKPIKLVLPYSPGGIIDYVGRQVAQHLGESIGQPVVAENRPGAGGISGTDTVARSAPDGYTLVLMDPAIVINPTLQPSMPYDLFKQLQTVSIISTSPEVLVVDRSFR
jgi:tripartite-type tricarboxylate transporter receptor subunit TctC